MCRIRLRQVLLPFTVALICLGLLTVIHAAFAEEVPDSSSVGTVSSSKKANDVPGEESSDDASLPLTNYYDLEVEVLVKGSTPPNKSNPKKAWHIKTAIWRDLPFELTVNADGEEFLVRGTLSEVKKGRLRLAITIRRAGSDWHRETKTTIDLVPQQRVQIATFIEQSPPQSPVSYNTFVTLRQRAPHGLVLRRKAPNQIAQQHTRKYE